MWYLLDDAFDDVELIASDNNLLAFVQCPQCFKFRLNPGPFTKLSTKRVIVSNGIGPRDVINSTRTTLNSPQGLGSDE